MIELPFNSPEFSDEMWKTIPGFEGYYQVSSLGRIKSLSRKIYCGDGNYRITKEKILKLGTSVGCPSITLWKHHLGTSYKIHQLMAIAFLNHSPNGQKRVVDHINNNRTDNRLCNLQIITQRENASKDSKRMYSKFVGVTRSVTKGKRKGHVSRNIRNGISGSCSLFE